MHEPPTSHVSLLCYGSLFISSTNTVWQVYVFLRSKSWDTRIASGHAIDYIAANAPLWDPEVQPADATGM